MPSTSLSGHQAERGQTHTSQEVAGDRLGVGAARQRRMMRGGAEHQHLVRAAERGDAGLDADHCVGADRARLGGDAIQGEVAGGVENVAVFLDLAAAEV